MKNHFCLEFQHQSTKFSRVQKSGDVNVRLAVSG